jgi:hypothetical protein
MDSRRNKQKYKQTKIHLIIPAEHMSLGQAKHKTCLHLSVRPNIFPDLKHYIEAFEEGLSLKFGINKNTIMTTELVD